MTAKGLARIGLWFSLALCSAPGRDAMAGVLSISEIAPSPAAASEWFERSNPAVAPVNLDDTTPGGGGNDLHRIETDLLKLPGYFLTLARCGDPGFARHMMVGDMPA